MDTLRRRGLGALDAIASHVCAFVFRQVSLLSKVTRQNNALQYRCSCAQMASKIVSTPLTFCFVINVSEWQARMA